MTTAITLIFLSAMWCFSAGAAKPAWGALIYTGAAPLFARGTLAYLRRLKIKHLAPFQGLANFTIINPGRCPGLSPVAALRQISVIRRFRLCAYGLGGRPRCMKRSRDIARVSNKAKYHGYIELCSWALALIAALRQVRLTHSSSAKWKATNR